MSSVSNNMINEKIFDNFEINTENDNPQLNEDELLFDLSL